MQTYIRGHEVNSRYTIFGVYQSPSTSIFNIWHCDVNITFILSWYYDLPGLCFFHHDFWRWTGRRDMEPGYSETNANEKMFSRCGLVHRHTETTSYQITHMSLRTHAAITTTIATNMDQRRQKMTFPFIFLCVSFLPFLFYCILNANYLLKYTFIQIYKRWIIFVVMIFSSASLFRILNIEHTQWAPLFVYTSKYVYCVTRKDCFSITI